MLGSCRASWEEAALPYPQQKSTGKKSMNETELELPEYMKKNLRALMLAQINTNTFDVFEIELFDWYVKETESIINEMLSSGQSYIHEQTAAGVPDINDSGMVAVDYYTKRIRYSHIIYLTSLLESCLDRACSNLTIAIGKEKIPFGLNDLKGDQWSKRRNFLERYGRFVLPKERWSAEVETLILVRNHLVHENGKTEKLNVDLQKRLGKCPGLDINGYEFKIEDGYIQHAFQAVKAFVNAVEAEVGKIAGQARHVESSE